MKMSVEMKERKKKIKKINMSCVNNQLDAQKKRKNCEAI